MRRPARSSVPAAAEGRKLGEGGHGRHLQLIRFLMVGGLATLLNSIIFSVLAWGGMPYQLAMTVGFVSGAVFGYLLNSRFTFGAASRSLRQALGYIAVNAFSLLAGVIVLTILVDFAGLGLPVSGVLVICLTTCSNYLGSRYLVFAAR